MPAKKQGGSKGGRQSLVGAGRRIASAPNAFSYKNGSRQTYFRSKTPSLKGATVAFQGCDFVASEVAATTLQDFFFSVIPTSAAFTKLSVIAPVFAMYRFTKLRVIIEGKTPSTVPGVVAVSGEYDAQGTLAAWTQAQVRNQEGVRACKFWETLVYEYDTKKNSYNWYHHEVGTGDVSVTETQGDIHIVADGVSAAFYTAGSPLIDIWVEYEIEFAESIQAGTSQVDLVLNQALKHKVFTQYVSNLAAKILSPAILERLRKRQERLSVHTGTPSEESEDSAVRSILSKCDPSCLPPLPSPLPPSPIIHPANTEKFCDVCRMVGHSTAGCYRNRPQS